MAVTVEAVVNAVSAALHKVFPDRPVYINQQEQDFKRPSFFVDAVYWTRARQNIGTDRTELFLTVYCLEKLTVNRNGDLALALQTADKGEGLFRLGALPVGDRVLKVSASRGGQDRGECDVDLTVSWNDWNGYDPDAGYPLMEKLHTEVVPDESW